MKRIFTLIYLLAPMMLSAQITVNFEGNDYDSIGVYDMWEESPFRTGKLSGNCAVIANHLKDSLNKSDKVLALQRSRYASNTFRVR
jgi:hypothetical protein